MILRMIQGFLMALADSVPGVSGGTVAFILGFYEKFIGSLNDILGTSKEKRKEAFVFLIRLGIGWAIGMILAMLFITSIFERNIYAISSVFIGFIIFAIPVIAKQEKECLKGKYGNLFFTLLGGIVVVLITYFSGTSLFPNGVDLSFGKFSPITGALVFVAGLIAISAMVLPGISGSTMLMIFGLYVPITMAIKEVLHFKFEYVPALILFGLGIICGALSIVKLVKKVMERFRSQTVYCVLGLMIGSIYSICMGPTTLDVPEPAMGLKEFKVLFFLLGGVIILALEAMKSYTEKKATKDE